MVDDVFARVARWWDSEAMLSEKRALLALIGADVAQASTWWENLNGDLRWRLVASMRSLVKLAAVLEGVLS